MRSSLRLTVLLATLVILSGACADSEGVAPTQPGADTPPAVSLDGTSWAIVRGVVDGADFAPIEGRPLTFAVSAGAATGSTGCNGYTADMAVSPAGVVSLSGLVITEVGCDPMVMDVEARLLAALGRVDRFEWDGDALTLGSGDGSVSLDLRAAVAQPDLELGTPTWELDTISLGGQAFSVVSGTAPSLVVDVAAGALRGNGGCNDFGAQVTLHGNEIAVSDLIHTEIACETAIMRQEARYFEILGAAKTWRIEASVLSIADAGDSKLTFVGLVEQ